MSDHFKGWQDGHLPPPEIPEQEPAEQIKEGGGQVLDIGAIADGKFLKRSGTSVIGDVAVGLSGDETIAGIKTFSSIPVLPASDPTTDNQAVRKAYADIRRMHVCVVPHNVALTTGYLTYIPIFEYIHLLDVECMVWVPSTSGSPQIRLIVGGNDILSKNLFIDKGENWSMSATKRKVINPVYDDFGAIGMGVYCQDAGVGTKGLEIWFKVQLL